MSAHSNQTSTLPSTTASRSSFNRAVHLATLLLLSGIVVLLALILAELKNGILNVSPVAVNEGWPYQLGSYSRPIYVKGAE
ncbi:hypothetical protein BFJ68_g17594 [Fusarium oxysporum]|uniref:Uncharacterized protein n=1 Tax=Fusarium oxysporum TaxID=5507 RepID=A0A420NNB4_FUSOX|nr:hypothetical protein BFJ68_g17594 [Fusarium oxysporum]